MHCYGLVHVVDNKIIKLTEHNNHIPNVVKIEAKKVVITLKKNVLQITLSIQSVLGNAAM